jgi:hypothetical protein
MPVAARSAARYSEAILVVFTPKEGRFMKLRTAAISVALGTIGVVALPASAALAVNTSYVNFNTMPPTNQAVACHYSTTATLRDTTVQNVENNCSVRMWLHQYVNGTGYNQCISPKTDPAVNAFRTYRQVQVTSNTAAC